MRGVTNGAGHRFFGAVAFLTSSKKLSELWTAEPPKITRIAATAAKPQCSFNVERVPNYNMLGDVRDGLTWVAVIESSHCPCFGIGAAAYHEDDDVLGLIVIGSFYKGECLFLQLAL